MSTADTEDGDDISESRSCDSDDADSAVWSEASMPRDIDFSGTQPHKMRMSTAVIEDGDDISESSGRICNEERPHSFKRTHRKRFRAVQNEDGDEPSETASSISGPRPSMPKHKARTKSFLRYRYGSSISESESLRSDLSKDSDVTSGRCGTYCGSHRHRRRWRPDSQCVCHNACLGHTTAHSLNTPPPCHSPGLQANQENPPVEDATKDTLNQAASSSFWSWKKTILLLSIVVIASIYVGSCMKGYEVHEAKRMTVVLLGKRGSGKSATGNTILGREAFKEDFSPYPVTKQCEVQSGIVFGRNITVIDTPDLSNTSFRNELVDTVSHVFLLIIRLGQSGTENVDSVKVIKDTFGNHVLNSTMVLLTGGDFLKSTPVSEFLDQNNSVMKIIHILRGEYHVFDNKARGKRTQVKELLKKIDNRIYKNAGHAIQSHSNNSLLSETTANLTLTNRSLSLDGGEESVNREVNGDRTKDSTRSMMVSNRLEILGVIILGLSVAVVFILISDRKAVKQQSKEEEKRIREEEEEKRAVLERKWEEKEHRMRLLEEEKRDALDRKREEREREIHAEEERKREERERTIRMEEERKRDVLKIKGEEKERAIRAEEERKREERERAVREEEGRKREERERTIREEEKKQRDSLERERDERERDIRAEAERKREEIERAIRADEERKRKEIERAIRAEEERKREERERAIREEEERKREERERAVREEEERKRDDRERTIRVEEERKRDALEIKGEEKERAIRAEEERKRDDRERAVREEEGRKRDDRERTIRVEEERKREERERAVREEEERKREERERAVREEEERKTEERERAIRAEEERKRNFRGKGIRVDKEIRNILGKTRVEQELRKKREEKAHFHKLCELTQKRETVLIDERKLKSDIHTEYMQKQNKLFTESSFFSFGEKKKSMMALNEQMESDLRAVEERARIEIEETERQMEEEEKRQRENKSEGTREEQISEFLTELVAIAKEKM